MTTHLSEAQIEARRAGGRARAQQASFKLAQSAGGKARAAQPSFLDAQRKGYAATVERHPEMRGFLHRKLRAFNVSKAQQLGITYRTQVRRVRARAAEVEAAFVAAFNKNMYAEYVAGAPLPAGSLWAM